MQQSTGGGGDDTSGHDTTFAQPSAPASSSSPTSTAATDADTSSATVPARPLTLRTDLSGTTTPIHAETPTTATGIGTLTLGGVASGFAASPPSRTSALASSPSSVGVGVAVVGTHRAHGHSHSASIDSTPSLHSPSDWSASGVTSTHTTPAVTPRNIALTAYPLFSAPSTHTTATPISQSQSINTSVLNSPRQSPLSSIQSTRPPSPKAASSSAAVAAGGDAEESDDSLFGDESGDDGGGDDESADTKTSRSSGARRKKAKVLRDNPEALSTPIECGALDDNGERVYEEDSAYFAKRVEIYTATRDPMKRILYRASVLAEKFKCATNKVGMYLARRRDIESGLYQATQFRHKPAGRSGLKAGGYFLSMEVCLAFEAHYVKQTTRKRQKAMADLQESPNAIMTQPSTPTLAGPSSHLNLSQILAWMLPSSDIVQRTHLVQQLQAAMSAGIITPQPSIIQIQTFVQHYLALQFASQSTSQQLPSSSMALPSFGAMNPSFLSPQLPMSSTFMNMYNPAVPVMPLSAPLQQLPALPLSQFPSASLERQLLSSGLTSPTAKTPQSQASSPRSPHLSARAPSPQPLRRVLGSPGVATTVRPRSVNSPRLSSRTMGAARPPSAASKTPTPIAAAIAAARPPGLYLHPSSVANSSMPSSPTSQQTSPPQHAEAAPNPSPTLTAAPLQSGGVTLAELQLQQQLLVQQQLQQQQQQAFVQMFLQQQQQQQEQQMQLMQMQPTQQQLAQFQQMQMLRLPQHAIIPTHSQSATTNPALSSSTALAQQQQQQQHQQQQQQPSSAPWYQPQFRRG